MKAITLTQPWATLVSLGAKTIETRSWGTSHRGWLAIHAAKTMPSFARDLCFDEPFFSALEAAGDWVPDAENPTVTKLNLPYGAIVAVVNLHHVGEIRRAWNGNPYVYPKDWSVTGDEVAFGDYTFGRRGWILANPHPLREPIPCRGAQGLWDIPAEIAAEIYRRFPDTAPLGVR